MLLREQSFSQDHKFVRKVLRRGYKCLTKQPRNFVTLEIFFKTYSSPLWFSISRPHHVSVNGDILLTASLTKVYIARDEITHTSPGQGTIKDIYNYTLNVSLSRLVHRI